jgi:hypothetical protein
MTFDEEDPRERERRRRRRHKRGRREARWHGCEESGGRWGDRKEKVLHTRISEGLAEDIREVADELRVPVSNLVRNVLEDVFSVVEAVTGNVGDLIDEVVDEAGRARETLGRRARRYARDARGFEDERGSSRSSEEELRAEEPVPEIPEFPDVLGWQPLILNAPKACAACHRSLKRGIRAFVGVTEAGLSPDYLCRRCAGTAATPS